MKKILAFCLIAATGFFVSINSGADPGDGHRRLDRECIVNMLSPYGQVIASFTGHDCRQAMNRCERELDRYQHDPRLARAYCQVDNNRRDPGHFGHCSKAQMTYDCQVEYNDCAQRCSRIFNGPSRDYCNTQCNITGVACMQNANACRFP